MLTKLLDEYVALRRATGFKFSTPAFYLRSFVAFAAKRGDRHVRAVTAVKWASLTKMPEQRYRRLSRCGPLCGALAGRRPSA